MIAEPRGRQLSSDGERAGWAPACAAGPGRRTSFSPARCPVQIGRRCRSGRAVRSILLGGAHGGCSEGPPGDGGEEEQKSISRSRRERGRSRKTVGARGKRFPSHQARPDLDGPRGVESPKSLVERRARRASINRAHPPAESDGAARVEEQPCLSVHDQQQAATLGVMTAAAYPMAQRPLNLGNGVALETAARLIRRASGHVDA